jgi:hypothetical protein
MKKLLFVTGILAALLVSCGDINIISGSSTRRTFWAQDLTKDYGDRGRFYQLTANLLAENEYCKVWVETTSGVDRETAQKMADAYIDIYTKMINVFGMNFRLSAFGPMYNTIQLADYIGDGDGKLCILLLDIKDGYKKGVNDATVGGYFYSGDFIDHQYSNKCDMICIDTNPGKPGEKESNTTLAHELQHLMNITTSMAMRNDGEYAYPMDTWIDEGLSSAAEWVYLEEHILNRWGWYYLNGDGNGLIDRGNNFFVWGNREEENQYAVLDDYATVYLFFQWLRIQSNKGVGIYRDIISSEHGDYQAVTKAAVSSIAAYSDWGALLENWLAANYIYAPTDTYGYKDDFQFYNKDNELLTIKGRNLLSTHGNTVKLYPGEGVFSKINGSYNTPADSGNIKYLNLTSALLTYNKSTISYEYVYNEKGEAIGTRYPDTATGTVTGVVSGSVSVPVEGRFLTAPGLAGPYLIGAGDVRRSGGAGNLLPAGVPRLLNSAAVSE